MWVLLKDFLLVSMGMGIGVVLMCMLSVGTLQLFFLIRRAEIYCA